MKPHILLYTDDPGIGGVAQYNHTLLCGLANAGYHLTSVQSQTSNPMVQQQTALGINHIWLDFDTTKDFDRTINNTQDPERVLSLVQPDLIIFSDSCPIANFAAKKVAIDQGIPYIMVVGLVDDAIVKIVEIYHRSTIKQYYDHAREIIAVSQDNLNFLKSHYYLPANQGKVIYYGRPAQYFLPPDPAVRQRLRRSYNIPEDAIVCLTVAAIEKRKGYQYQWQAIQQLKLSSLWDKLYFVWIGDGSGSNQLTALITQEEKLASKVLYLGRRWDVIEWLDTADIFVFPSEAEGMPLSVMEAMAKRLPVIATAVSGIPEELGNTGKLISDPKIAPNDTVKELVATIATWVNNPELRQQIGWKCHQRAVAMFKSERMIEETLAVVKQALITPGDYVSPGLEIVLPDQYFPHMKAADTNNCSWPYLRREIPHNWYADKRHPNVGFLSRDEAHILYNTARQFKGKQALEIGCWLGWSACHLALAGVKLDVVDPVLAKPEFAESIRYSLTAAGVIDSVNLVAGYSPQKVEEIAAQFQRQWPLIFIDGNHEGDAPLQDAIACEPLAAADAIVIFHDLASPYVARGLDYFKQKGWNTMIYQTMQIMGVAWRGNVEPVKHQPDPKINWQLPKHLQHYQVSSISPTPKPHESQADEFRQILAKIRPYTLLSEERLHSLYTLAKQICQEDIPGNFVECGTYKGGAAALLAFVIKSYSLRPRLLYAFDTFEGMPEPTELDTHNKIPANQTKFGAGTLPAPIAENLDKVCRLLGVRDHVVPVKGLFQDTLPQYQAQIQAIAFLHADADWYESTMTIFDLLYDSIVPNGIIQIDDYGYWEGCRQAIQDFETKRGLKFQLHQIDDTGVWLRHQTAVKIQKMQIIIDGVFFQINNSGIARVWASLLREWAGSEFAQNILLLDRAGTAPRIPGIKYLCINPYNYNNTEADRAMLQQICDAEQADLFISTYYTTPITTPSVLLAHDMIPEIIKADLSAPMWQEKHQAIRHATAYISVSENTAKDLVKCFPEISPDSVTVAHCGISSHFQPVNAAAIDQFKAKYHISKPYFVVVGDRAGLNGYKNTILFFQAFAQLPQSQETEIICVGGRPQLEPQLKASAPDAKVHLLTLNDSELAAAYSGAIALVYPSKYEGFGLPIIEAMACGCPVITTPNGAIPEAAGTAALYIKHDDIPALTTALINIQNPQVRQPLIAAGFVQAQKFSWAKMAATVRHALIQSTNPSNPSAPLSKGGQGDGKTPAPEPAISPSQMPALQQADIANILQKYEQNPSDANNLAHIRQLRQQIAQAWLNTPSEHLDTAYNGDLGKTHRALLDSGLKINHSITDIPISEAEQPLFQEISAKIASGFNHPLALQSILAVMLYRRAYKLPLQYQGAPIPKWFIKDFLHFLLDTPQYFQEIGETEKYYTYLHGLIQYLHQRIVANPDSPIWQEISWLFAQRAFFLPLYFSPANLKDIYTKRSDIAEFALKNRGSQLNRQIPPRSPQRNKIRLGVLNIHFNPKTETFVTIPIIEHLNRDQFEIILYTIQANSNPLEQYCQSLADKFIKLPPDLTQQVEAIRNDDLDILFIGTNLTVGNAGLYLLPMHRLARLQVTSLSSPTTTGMPHIDCYIAGDLTAPPSFQDQYRERLVNIPGSGLCFHYPNYGLPAHQTPGPVTFAHRNSIGVSPEAVVFVSGANFYKITPELRQTWAKIIAAVPNSVLLLYPFGPAWMQAYPKMAFIEQMQTVFATYGIAPNRLKVLNTLPSRLEVKQVLQLADVYLDSYPYGGATSLLDPLEVGLPPVVVEGNALRFRQASALMRELQITDFIATGDESYIKLAITLGNNPQLRQQYRQQILAKMQANPAFLDSRTYGAKIGNLFQELFHQWQQGGNLSQLPSSPPLAGKMPAPRTEFINQLIGCANLHYIDPTDQPIIAELRQLRRELADFWLTVPPEQIPDFYNGDVGKAHQALVKSGFLAQPLTEEENSFLKPLLQRLEAGGNAPSTPNYSQAVELYRQ